MAQIQALLGAFMNASGYYEIFIPAMKRLSPSYAAYSRQLEQANEVLLRQFPQMAGEQGIGSVVNSGQKGESKK